MAVYEQNSNVENIQGVKRREMLLEKPSRIGSDVSSLTPQDRAKKIRQSAIEDILQTVKIRDMAIKERGDVKNNFKREV